uniref:HupA receptor n=1 Tax=Ganoderma boninense TaxID=34458 RepID=A0A5K1K586_9APHY|nr:HupA receptor [Ganoderma boninense]
MDPDPSPAHFAGDAASNDEPTVILIFGWLGAKMPTLRKYSDAYRKLYPSSAQIVIQADSLRYWKLGSARDRAVLPAVQTLKEMGLFSATLGSPPPRILFHVMSNGGVMSLCDMATVLRKLKIQPAPGSKCAIVFDSTPTPTTYTITIRAFTAGMRGWLRKLLTAGALTVVLFLTFVIRTILRRPRPFTRELTGLNDPALLPWTSKATPRLYLYSTADAIVPASAVEEHAAHARMAGFPVEMVNFGRSAHVSHARDYPEKYWDAVGAFWAEATKA